MMKFTHNRKEKGFTLVETLVAISIFTLSILAMMATLSKGISDTGYAKKKVIASYLAQEGVEYLRNIRDTYMLYSPTAAAGWASFNTKLTAAGCGNTNGCYFNADNLYSQPNPMPMTRIPFAACSTTCPQLKYDPATGKYAFATGAAAGYIRKIRAVPINANETKIFSTVQWAQGSGTYTINLSESVYNWIE